MTFATIEKEVQKLDPDKQDRLAAVLSILRMRRDPGHAKELAKRLSDKNAANWMPLNELRQKLAKG
jgi:hypothetical protein